MRAVRFSQTALDEVEELLAQGVPFYSREFLEYQRLRLFASIRRYLVSMPEMHPVNPGLGVRIHFVDHTPFFVAYDFDRDEVRIHSVRHRHAQRHPVKPSAIQW